MSATSAACEAWGCDGKGRNRQGRTYKNGYPENQYGDCGLPCHRVEMCQCGHTREGHQADYTCFACAGDLPCDAPGVTVKMTEFAHTWRWDLRCARHGTLRVGGPLDNWEPDAVTRFRFEHAGHRP